MKQLLVIFLLWSMAAHAATPKSDSEFSRTFRCPESMSSDKARNEAMQSFGAWIQKAHPNWSISDVVGFRMKLLKQNNCVKTLSNIQSSVRLEANGSVRNLCVDTDGKRYFHREPTSNCTAIPLENGWVNIYTSSEVIVDVMPSTVVKEKDGTKLWTQFFLADAIPSDDGAWRYNEVRSISKFYCEKRQTRLIQGTYSLDGRRVYERASTEAITEEIDPQTINNTLYENVCGK